MGMFLERSIPVSGPDTISSEPKENKKTILVIEDDPTIAEFLVEYLHEEKAYQVYLATDGKKALQIVQDVQPNLFVIDQLLPGMKGLEVYDHLQAMQGLDAVPVLIISAAASSEEVSQRHLPFLRKPFTLEELDAFTDNLCPCIAVEIG